MGLYLDSDLPLDLDLDPDLHLELDLDLDVGLEHELDLSECCHPVNSSEISNEIYIFKHTDGFF